MPANSIIPADSSTSAAFNSPRSVASQEDDWIRSIGDRWRIQRALAPVSLLILSSPSTRKNRLLTPALSSFEEEREIGWWRLIPGPPLPVSREPIANRRKPILAAKVGSKMGQ